MYGTIPVDEFVTAMAARWAGHLGNVLSDALRATWHQMGETFNAHIGDDCPPWRVLQPATGTGKSQGLALYLALLSRHLDERHPGALVVVRTIEDAERMAQLINELGTRPTAFAYHSKLPRRDPSRLREYAVVVCTHKAFTLALDPAAPLGNPWENFSSWRGGERRLAVIDEALDMVHESEVTIDDLRRIEAAIPVHLHEHCPNDIRIVRSVIDMMTDHTNAATYTGDTLLELLGESGVPTFADMREQFPAIRFETDATGREDLAERARLRARHVARLDALAEVLSTWAYITKLGKKLSMSTSRLLVPFTGRGAVVLDATADADLTYDLFGVQPIKAPVGARSYENVTVHLAEGCRTGGSYWRANAAKLAPVVVASLGAPSPDSRGFLCCHKDAEACFAGMGGPFDLRTGHWGAVDGSNEWQDCGFGVFVGLPHLPDSRSVNEFFAYQGMQSTEWLRGDSRPYGRHKDIRKARRYSAMVVSVVQALNRTRCRRVIDAQGNCAPTALYLMLPRERELAEAIREGIRRAMPGVKFAAWDFDSATRRPNQQPERTDYGARLLKHAKNMPAGRASLSWISNALGVPPRMMTRLAAVAENCASDLYAALAAVGVTLERKGAGRGSRAYLVKA